MIKYRGINFRTKFPSEFKIRKFWQLNFLFKEENSLFQKRMDLPEEMTIKDLFSKQTCGFKGESKRMV